ncbi:VWA domain-containing protein [bacterium]|nr:VWA domain-containing protein [bacterium]
MKKLILSLTISTLFFACSQEYAPSAQMYYVASVVVNDKYEQLEENPFLLTKDEPVSTFSIDADGASYANARRFLNENSLPPTEAIRTEEFINYFDVDYNYENSGHPISLNGEVSTCPWNAEHQLIRIGIQGKPLSPSEMPASNYVFLIDASGSMNSDDKLELLKSGFIKLTDELSAKDRIAIVVYTGSAGLYLESTPGDQKDKIKDAIGKLGAGGSTAGAEGIITAYEIAEANFIEGGNNRIILGTDGDFNVGIRDQDDLVKLIEEKRKSGVYLTVLGVGRGNLNDAAMEQIANHGNGTYEYIDNVEQLEKVFIHEKSKFYTVAKDVKVQVEFNPDLVKSYRLIGYENRMLSKSDFTNDSSDAGEIGANQNITALYETVPVKLAPNKTGPTFTIDFRYKMPDSESSIPMRLEFKDEGNSFENSSDQMRFVSGVAYFGLMLRESEYLGDAGFAEAKSWVQSASLPDPRGFKSELIQLIDRAASLK